MSLDKALQIVLAGDGRPNRLQRSVPEVRFSMEKEAALCFAEIQGYSPSMLAPAENLRCALSEVARSYDLKILLHRG